MVTVGERHSGPVDQLQLLSRVNSVAGAKGLLKGPLTIRPERWILVTWWGLDWQAWSELRSHICSLEISEKGLSLSGALL